MSPARIGLRTSVGLRAGRERPASREHDGVWRTYEARRAEATSAAFARLTALGPKLITAELADDPVTAAPLALTVRPERAVLTGDRARVMRQLKRGRPSRLRFSHNYEADRKRLQRERAGTLSCTGRGERSRTANGQLNVPEYRLHCEITGREPWLERAG